MGVLDVRVPREDDPTCDMSLSYSASITECEGALTCDNDEDKDPDLENAQALESMYEAVQ